MHLALQLSAANSIANNAMGAILGSLIGGTIGESFGRLRHYPGPSTVKNAMERFKNQKEPRVSWMGEIIIALCRSIGVRCNSLDEKDIQPNPEKLYAIIRNIWKKEQIDNSECGFINPENICDAIVRMIPIGVFYALDGSKRISKEARIECMRTHEGAVTIDCCIAYSIAIAHLLEFPSDYHGAIRRAAASTKTETARTWFKQAVNINVDNINAADTNTSEPLFRDVSTSTDECTESKVNENALRTSNKLLRRNGFVLALWHLWRGTHFEAAVADALQGPPDLAQTNAMIVGGLLGAYWGVNVLPNEWTEQLLGEKYNARIDVLRPSKIEELLPRYYRYTDMSALGNIRHQRGHTIKSQTLKLSIPQKNDKNKIKRGSITAEVIRAIHGYSRPNCQQNLHIPYLHLTLTALDDCSMDTNHCVQNHDIVDTDMNHPNSIHP